jgi:hypothetical protein
MTMMFRRAQALLNRLWAADRALTLTGLLMLPPLALFAAGLLLDARIVTGAPVWLKPAKFAASIAIYSFTLAWTFQYLRDWPRVRRTVRITTTAAMLIELVVIALQAGRGTTSHFNVGTPLDAVLFGIMGLTIVFQTLMSIAVAVALWRQTFDDRALGWALRFGISITIVGASIGGLMTRPTSAQMAAVRQEGRMTISGAHTVGAVDGGPGLPGTGWSVEHGDLRVAHFIGLHAFQALPLMALLIRRRGWPAVAQARAIIVAALSYAMLFCLLLWQALRGQSLISPDAVTLTAVATWAILTLVATLAARASRRSAKVALLA